MVGQSLRLPSIVGEREVRPYKYWSRFMPHFYRDLVFIPLVLVYVITKACRIHVTYLVYYLRRPPPRDPPPPPRDPPPWKLLLRLEEPRLLAIRVLLPLP